MHNRHQAPSTPNYRRQVPQGPPQMPHPPEQYPSPQYQPLYVDTGFGQSRRHPNEVDPGMNGDGWQGPGGRGAHHMNGGGGGRRGGGGGSYNQRMPPNHHQGGMNRMMPPAFRPQQQQYMPPYAPMGGMPGDVMDLNMRMDGMSLASTPSQGMPGQYGDMGPPQQQWNQPAPFAAPPPQQDELYDPTGGYGGHHQQMPPYGQQRGGQSQYGNRMQQGGGGGGYRGNQQRQGYNMPPMMVPQNQQPYFGGGQNHQQQPPYAPSPFSMSGGGGSQTPHDHMGGHGGHGPNGNFGGTSSSMDDYSMWTDENDEEAKRKKTLRDKGLLAWGDSEVSNNKPIRRWLVPEGQEEDFESAMERCPSHLKKKALNEEALRRRLGSDNPQVVAQAQQQAEEEANATMKIGRRPIIPCGWGDLPSELSGGDKSEYDQGSSKGWDDGSLSGRHHHQHHHQDDSSLWHNPSSGGGGGSSNETRNPFFAQHMQQQQHQQQQSSQHQQQHYGVYGDNAVLDGGSVWGAVMDGSSMGPPMGVGGGPSSTSSSMPMGMLMMSAVAAGGAGTSTAVVVVADEDGSQKKLAENLKLAVEKGHLDISLLSLPHIPPNVLDLLTEILTVIPRLDGFEDELKKLADSRPSNFEEGNKDSQDQTWMNKDQKNEHEKAVIGVVTSKIEVTQLSKKINDALVDAGLIPAPPTSSASNHHHHGGPPPGADGGAGPSAGGDSFNNSGGPPDHYYDYSFLG